MQLKEQFMHGWNNAEMLAEIIRELTKCDENMTILIEHVLTLAKKIEAQRAQIWVKRSLCEIKNFDANIYTDGKQRETRPTKTVTTNARRCKYCSRAHKLRWYPVYGKKCDKCGMLNHFRKVCRSFNSSTVHTMEKEVDQVQGPGIKTINVKSVRFSSNYSAINYSGKHKNMI